MLINRIQIQRGRVTIRGTQRRGCQPRETGVEVDVEARAPLILTRHRRLTEVVIASVWIRQEELNPVGPVRQWCALEDRLALGWIRAPE